MQQLVSKFPKTRARFNKILYLKNIGLSQGQCNLV